jgi:hypothetical protein
MLDVNRLKYEVRILVYRFGKTFDVYSEYIEQISN